MDSVINDTTNLIFEVKEQIGDGAYVKLMDNMKALHGMRGRNVGSKRKKFARTIPLILKAWINNEEGGTANGSFTTERGKLYSYNYTIGYTRHDDIKCVVDHTASGLGFCSNTTSCHVMKARRYCDGNGILYDLINGTNAPDESDLQ